jgi:putative ABC transport system substrate-binding protein
MRFDHLRRREFIALLGGAAAWPLASRAQQTGKVWRVGFLAGGTRPVEIASSPYAGFLHGMRELGYVEDRDFVMEWRFAETRPDLFPALASELVRLKVDLIVLGTATAIRPARQATETIPLVMGDSTNPVERGFVASLAHPGGNITGVASSREDTTPKQIQLMTEVVPRLARLGFAVNPANEGHPILLSVTKAAAERARLALVPVEMRVPEDIPRAFAALADAQAGALLVASDPLFFAQRQRLADLALKSRLPTMFGQRDYAEAGGLMSYGQGLAEFYRRAASYADKIFRGAKPADLPVEQPTKFDFVINRKTADALGIAIPPALYIFADEIIE